MAGQKSTAGDNGIESPHIRSGPDRFEDRLALLAGLSGRIISNLDPDRVYQDIVAAACRHGDQVAAFFLSGADNLLVRLADGHNRTGIHSLTDESLDDLLEMLARLALYRLQRRRIIRGLNGARIENGEQYQRDIGGTGQLRHKGEDPFG
tara:strand:- start:92 stop:541 length:450 start_codon:yes stop_codon:yes gene_type:complete